MTYNSQVNLKILMQNHHRLPHGTFDGMDKEEEVLVLPMKTHKFVYTIYSTKSVQGLKLKSWTREFKCYQEENLVDNV